MDYTLEMYKTKYVVHSLTGKEVWSIAYKKQNLWKTVAAIVGEFNYLDLRVD